MPALKMTASAPPATTRRTVSRGSSMPCHGAQDDAMVQRDHHRFPGVGIDNAVVADFLADVDGSFPFSLEVPFLTHSV